MTDIQGLPARRAAMQLLDAVLRRGQALEAALAGATRGIENSADRALAHAIASETLRHIPDLDDLIDSATRQRLPDDAKARMVLRIALVQALVLGTPPHAAIATALPMSVLLTFICRTLARCRLFLTASCVPAML